MARLLIVHHTPSPSMQAMLEAVVAGAGTDEIEGVEVVIRPALTASAVNVLSADGYLLGTAANIGYMSGALKHFFDGILPVPRRDPAQALWPVRARQQRHRGRGTGGGGHHDRAAVASSRPPVTVVGDLGSGDLEACWELGATVATGLVS